MQNKNEVKHLILFFVISFGLCWIPIFVLYSAIGYKVWFNHVITATKFAPAFACILVRIISNEKWDFYKVIAKAGAEETLLTCDIDLGEATRIRNEKPYFGTRRKEFYL